MIDFRPVPYINRVILPAERVYFKRTLIIGANRFCILCLADVIGSKCNSHSEIDLPSKNKLSWLPYLLLRFETILDSWNYCLHNNIIKLFIIFPNSIYNVFHGATCDFSYRNIF